MTDNLTYDGQPSSFVASTDITDIKSIDAQVVSLVYSRRTPWWQRIKGKHEARSTA